MDASNASESGWRGALLGLLILATGFGLGALFDARDFRPRSRGQRPSTDGAGATTAGGALLLASSPFDTESSVQVLDNGFETLELTLKPKAVGTLVARRTELLQRMRVMRSDDGIVDASVECEGETFAAKLRLKGDQVDHVDTHKWSMRIELEDARLFGMARFSIQHPKTRGFAMEWLATNVARREGLLAPRSRFVNVVINGRPNGIYYLEEHCSKELLESQGRREGPIVRFHENAFWSWLQHYRRAETRPLELASRPGNPAYFAEVGGFGEKRLSSSDPLAAQLQSALDKLRTLQLKLVEASLEDLREPGHTIDRDTPLALYDARRDQRAQLLRAGRAQWLARVQADALAADTAIDALLDMKSAAHASAVLSLFGGTHGLTWHNMRFYHDPVRERLEMIVNDTGARAAVGRLEDPLVWAQTQVGLQLARHPEFYLQTMRDLARLSEPAWLDETASALGTELQQITDALLAEGLIGERNSASEIWNGLRARQLFLKSLFEQRDPVSFMAELAVDGTGPDAAEASRSLVIEAWSTTRVPVVLEGFVYSNGDVVNAARALASDASGAIIEGGTVVLPWDGRRVRFVFDVDERLDALNEIDAVATAVKARTARDRAVRLRLDARFRTLGSERVRTERLRVRRSEDRWRLAGGRPPAPTVPEALAAHPCLGYDVEAAQLFIQPGVWDIDGDLVVPQGAGALHVHAGTTLRFGSGAALVSEVPLRFAGTVAEPIVLTARGAQSWAGVLVIDAVRKSMLDHVHISAASAIERGGWITTGGWTCYRTPVEFRNCRFTDVRGEDALNIFGTEFLLDGCTFKGTASDAFDGDFVTGLVRDCVFQDTVEDAVDTSGSEVAIVGCRFKRIGDKAISGGEGSTLRARDCVIDGAAIGAASKDASTVEIASTTIAGIRHFALAAYVKKDAFGASALVATDVSIDAAPAKHTIVQEGSQMTVDGTSLETTQIDVKALYEAGILGAPDPQTSDGK